MHVAFVQSEHRRTQQARRQSCKIDETRRLRYSLLREISREECRKHQSADDQGGRNGYLSEYIESVKKHEKAEINITYIALSILNKVIFLIYLKSKCCTLCNA